MPKHRRLRAVVATKEDVATKGLPNGYAGLSPAGLVPTGLLPPYGIYRGTWNATTNSPTIAPGSGIQGDFYKVTTAGSTLINGAGPWLIGDEIFFTGTVWTRIPGRTVAVWG
jgi:hypothetical protein